MSIEVKGPCREGAGHRSPRGYCRTTRGGRRVLAHRAAWADANGPIPAGQVVRHKCDNPPCVNPDHLELGTVADNNRDVLERHPRPKKLFRDDVPEVRKAVAEGVVPYALVGEMYGITRHQVSLIARNLSWELV